MYWISTQIQQFGDLSGELLKQQTGSHLIYDETNQGPILEILKTYLATIKQTP